jgi:hypothetical protein
MKEVFTGELNNQRAMKLLCVTSVLHGLGAYVVQWISGSWAIKISDSCMQTVALLRGCAMFATSWTWWPCDCCLLFR